MDIALSNNFGVDFLRRGDLASAAVFFRQALEGTRSHSELTSMSPETQPLETELECIRPRLSFAQEVGLPESIPSTHAPAFSSAPSRSCDASMYLHTKGICLLPGNGLSYSSDPLVNLSIVSSIILYNLGLISQLQGLYCVGYGNAHPPGAHEVPDSFDIRQRHTQKAFILYSRSVLILQEAGVNTRQATGLPVLDFLCMALFNNAGYIAFVQGNYEAAVSNFKELEEFSKSLRLVSLHNSWDGETYLLMDKYMSDFLLNTVVLREPIIAAAA